MKKETIREILNAYEEYCTKELRAGHIFEGTESLIDRYLSTLPEEDKTCTTCKHIDAEEYPCSKCDEGLCMYEPKPAERDCTHKAGYNMNDCPFEMCEECGWYLPKPSRP